MADDKSGGSVTTDGKPVTNREECFTETDAMSSSSLDPSEEYNMDHKRRGMALIFNQENFLYEERRIGTQADSKNLKKSLKELNFNVKVYNDCTTSTVKRKIRKAANADHSDADCFVLVFLSHGEKDNLSTYDDVISIEDVTAPFQEENCRGLAGKPKIFILQACRGKVADVSVATPCGGESEPELVAEECAVFTLPAGADFIMCYSVAEGYVSFRKADGSWYIQALCEMLQNHGTSLEFTDLLTVVNMMVSKRSSTHHKNKDLDGKKQIPCFASMLTKQLIFKPKEKAKSAQTLFCLRFW